MQMKTSHGSELYFEIFIKYYFLTKQSIKTVMTVGLISLLLKCSFVQLLETKAAHKMLWMKLSKHCSNTATLNWFMTASTETAPESMIMILTVRKTFMFIKRPFMEWLSTLFAHKTIWMPLFVKSRYVVICYRKITTSTSRCKLSKIAIFAVCCIIFFMEPFFSKCFSTC